MVKRLLCLGPEGTMAIPWMDKFLHHLRNPGRMISRKDKNQQAVASTMVSQWCEMDFVHPQEKEREF